ncbi:RNA polymerase sigma factor OS=Streptomyces tendae OX=1932 GN=GUR47_20310 PE=3 SV=1 [Streptomyces tendae]
MPNCSPPYPRLAGWCRRLVDDDETAHEIASEAFTRLWARWTSVEEPRGFLYVTAANLVRDHWRKLERERRAVRRVTAEVAVRPHPEQADPSVRLLVQSLPERLRVPILLHYYADMPDPGGVRARRTQGGDRQGRPARGPRTAPRPSEEKP